MITCVDDQKSKINNLFFLAKIQTVFEYNMEDICAPYEFLKSVNKE